MRLLRKHSIGLTSTEFDYLDGVTSGIQTQMDGKSTASSTDSLTNKTFDANATGNSLSNVDLSADVTGTLPVANGGSGVTTSTGSGNTVLNNTPAIATPTLSGDVSISTGSLIIGTAGQGIDFTGNSRTATFDDYEEGTWEPTINSDPGYGSATRTGFYRKIGSLVQIQGTIENWDHTDNPNTVTIDNLPFTANSSNGHASGVCNTNQSNSEPTLCTVQSSATTMIFYRNSTGNNNRSVMLFNTFYDNTDRAIYWNAIYYTDS